MQMLAQVQYDPELSRALSKMKSALTVYVIFAALFSMILIVYGAFCLRQGIWPVHHEQNLLGPRPEDLKAVLFLLVLLWLWPLIRRYGLRVLKP